ncbi:hypothetical protein V6N11_000645 [Hibiscus sabdariffa]|uniref:Uncharacterized protein n=1 Tax=Hibiscus sabdariffa TaxID=183260 RepID=A0ABR2NEF0_9ROSI
MLRKTLEALLKVLNQTFVPDNISVGKLDRIMGNIAADNYITFSDDEIPEGGMGSTKALNITTHCKGVQVQGLRRKRCCSIPGRMLSNAMLHHWCTRGQTKEDDRGCTCPSLHVDF